MGRSSQQQPLFCDRCLRTLTPGAGDFYVVSIEAIADPTPMIAVDDMFRKDFQKEIRKLIASLESLSERELLDQVHRCLQLYLCTSCYNQWIENPAGS